MSVGRVLIYGGNGSLGSFCVAYFKNNNYWVGSVGFKENAQADATILVTRDTSWVEQENTVLTQVGDVLNGDKLDAVICVAGGWAGGNAKKDLIKTSELMWRQSVWTSTISATIAVRHLKECGLLALTGSYPALKGTPGMIGYGMAKAAVHQLTRSMGGKNSGLPAGAVAVSILPLTLDTALNRKWMPNADFSTWIPLDEVATLLHRWTKGEARPSSGSLMQMVTKGSVTQYTGC